MKANKTSYLFALCIGAAFSGMAGAADSDNRKELKRVDLSGAPGMEVISSISEYKPGETLPRHFHHGIESGYFVQGGMIQPPGKEAVEVPTGAPIMNLRDEPHGGFKIVGDTTIRIFTTHIVDKGKPLYDTVSK